ncbi:hypothetical protein BJ878DRAFT_483873 [Calycina marina]|uniref:Uncharacterized protein n=1 Tax=Calycina marina TaxID=1763456 RepID=A0A9P7YV71_9HELO|nr:hypothetical protein BJ878DRAFT_483873 [Calycina marina]
MLSRRFGDGILLTLPSSIGRSTLERKLPLDQETFDVWIAPVVGSTWEKQAEIERIRDLGQRIRQTLLERCLTRHASRSARPFKKRKTNIMQAAVQETTSSVTSIAVGSLASPITPSILPQGHRIHSKSINPAKQPTDVLNAANDQEMLLSNNLSAPPAQNDTGPCRAERQRTSQDETIAACGASPETFIPTLFYAMGDHIPKVVLDRATSPQPRWSEHGEFCEVTPHGAGLRGDLVDLLSDDAKLKQSIENLVSLSIISEVSKDGLQAYTCRDKPARVSYNQNRAYWIHRAFELCCFVFPRSEILDSSFGSVGKQLLHVLQHLLRLYGEAGLEIPPRKDAVEALIAASKFGVMSNRKYLLSIAGELQKDPEQTHLRAMIVHRESVLLRFSKKISDSQRVIQQFLDCPFPVANTRLHCLLGFLHLSQAENWAYQFSYGKVYEEAQKWEPGDNPTAMQLYVFRTELSVLGQSYKAMKPHDSERYLIKSYLADVYCELDYLKRKESVILNAVYLEEAEKIVSPELDHLRTRSRSSKPSRRLLLSLIEIEILRGRHSVAGSLIKELLEIYNGLSEHDTNDQVGHVRTLIAWARISAPSEAVARWHTAYYWNRVYNPSEEDVFTCGVIYLFISLAYFRLGNEHESRVSFDRASEIISRKKPQFLMPGVGTYLYYFARRELWSAAGLQLPGVPP